MSDTVILLKGDDDLLLQRALEDVLAELRADHGGLEVEIMEVGEAGGLPELRTASLFGGRSCVVLRGAEGLTGDLREEVAAYLDDPSEQATLVVVANGTGRIRTIVRRAEEAGRVVEVRRPRDWDDDAWRRLVGRELARLDREGTTAALEAIREHAGHDAAAIASKVGQVAAATEEGATVEVADVEAVVEGHGRVSGFAIADAVADRDPAATLVALRGALEAGEAPLALLGSVAYRFRQLVQVRGGVRPERMSSGQFRRLQGIARGFHPGELAACVDRLARTDVELKGSDLPDELILELALLEVATSREVGARWNPTAPRRRTG